MIFKILIIMKNLIDHKNCNNFLHRSPRTLTREYQIYQIICTVLQNFRRKQPLAEWLGSHKVVIAVKLQSGTTLLNMVLEKILWTTKPICNKIGIFARGDCGLKVILLPRRGLGYRKCV